jgi:AmiR/NasT family two-component response regulator
MSEIYIPVIEAYLNQAIADRTLRYTFALSRGRLNEAARLKHELDALKSRHEKLEEVEDDDDLDGGLIL